MKYYLSILSAIVYIAVAAQQEKTSLQKGNDFFKQGNYVSAEKEYNQLITEQPNNYNAKYNLANALEKQGKSDKANQLYDEIIIAKAEAALVAKAAYNKGVILSNQKKTEESIEAYKEALRKAPNDMQARENLQKALLELKKKKQSPKQQSKQPKPQPGMNQQQAAQRLKLLEQKEKELRQRIQNKKTIGAGRGGKDW